jgi:Na+/proline symporter
MGLGWDSVLRLAAVAVLVMVVLSAVFYFVFQTVGYDSYWLSVTLIAFILLFIILIVVWRIMSKKLAL